MSDDVFRGIAVERPTPEYPEASLRWGATGVAVAEALTTEQGRVGFVRVLEAPDALTAGAVQDALRAWEVQPLLQEDGTPVRVYAKLFFYFTMEDGRGAVRSPAEMLGEPLEEFSGPLMVGSPDRDAAGDDIGGAPDP